jgi:AraC-like DNA-binding protein
MPNNITVVKASHLQPFITFLDEWGAPVDSLLKQVNMDREQLSCSDNLVPEPPFWAFIALVANEPELADIGFKVTEQLALDSFGVFGAKVMQAENLHKALITFISTMGQQSNCTPFWLVKGEQGIWFYRLGTQGITKGNWPIEQHVVSLMIQLVRGFTRNDWTPPSVHLQTHTLKGAENTTSFKNSQVTTNKPLTGIFIPQTLLGNKSISDNKNNLIMAPKEHEAIPQVNSLVIKELLSQSSYTRTLNAEQTAQILGISVRQMQRLLKQEQSTFRQLSEEVLLEGAKAMLSDVHRSVIDIAIELGYSDSANFTRAFKRLSGMSPTQYKRHVEG